MHSNDKIRKCRSILEPCLALNATQTTFSRVESMGTSRVRFERRRSPLPARTGHETFALTRLKSYFKRVNLDLVCTWMPKYASP